MGRILVDKNIAFVESPDRGQTVGCFRDGVHNRMGSAARVMVHKICTKKSAVSEEERVFEWTNVVQPSLDVFH